jgi:hypothetical protein
MSVLLSRADINRLLRHRCFAFQKTCAKTFALAPTGKSFVRLRASCPIWRGGSRSPRTRYSLREPVLNLQAANAFKFGNVGGHDDSACRACHKSVCISTNGRDEFSLLLPPIPRLFRTALNRTRPLRLLYASPCSPATSHSKVAVATR